MMAPLLWLSLAMAPAVSGASLGFAGDCGGSGALIHFNNVAINNHIMAATANNVTADYQVSRALDSCDIRVKQSLYTCPFGSLNLCYQPFLFGCQDDFGNCEFQLCQRSGFPAFNPLFFDCAGSGNGDRAGATTLASGRHSATHRSYMIGGPETLILKGTYRSKVEYLDSSDNVVGCYQMYWTMTGKTSPCPSSVA